MSGERMKGCSTCRYSNWVLSNSTCVECAECGPLSKWEPKGKPLVHVVYHYAVEDRDFAQKFLSAELFYNDRFVAFLGDAYQADAKEQIAGFRLALHTLGFNSDMTIERVADGDDGIPF